MKKPQDESARATEMRLCLAGAAGVIDEYAVSRTAFDWERDIEIIRAITQNAAKLMALLDPKKGGD